MFLCVFRINAPVLLILRIYYTSIGLQMLRKCYGFLLVVSFYYTSIVVEMQFLFLFPILQCLCYAFLVIRQ